MSDSKSNFYLGKINLEKLEALKSKAYEGKWLDVAVFVSQDANDFDQHISIVHGKKGEDKVYVGNAKLWGDDTLGSHEEGAPF